MKDLLFGSLEAFCVLIEIPEGSSNKYEYDHQAEVLRFNFAFQNGFVWPFNYGEICGTKSGDGDCLDAIVLSSHPLASGTVVQCRAVAMIETLDRGEQDNKIICVPLADSGMERYEDIDDFSEEQLRSYEDLYHEIAVQKNKIIELKGFYGKKQAEEEIKKSLSQAAT